STKRVHYHRVAAEAAVERSDWSAVRQEVDSAFRHTPTRRERGKLLRLLVSAELAAHETERAFAHVPEALAVLDPTADADDVARLHYARGFAYVELGQLVAATDSFEAARDLVERHEIADPRLRSRILLALGTTYRRLDRTAKALATYESALALASRTSEFEVAARSHMGIAAAQDALGQHAAADGAYREAIRLVTKIEHHADRAAIATEYARKLRARGETEAAYDMLELARGGANKA